MAMSNKNSARKKPVTPSAHQDELESFFIQMPRPSSSGAVNRLMMTMGGFEAQAEKIEARIRKGDEPELVINDLANAIEASTVRADTTAQPPPADYFAMMRMADYLDRTEGDIHSTVSIPAEVILTPLEVTCEDEGAKKEWQALWKNLKLDELALDCYLTSEVLGQWFPLELIEGNQYTGIAPLNPMDVWVGRQSIMIPGDVPTGIDPKMWELALKKETTYQPRVTDQNNQQLRAPRTPVPTEFLKPVTTEKRSYQRYAVPHFARASRNAMHRQLLDEYRRGTVEAYISQILHVTIGDKDFPATPRKIAAIKNTFQDASKYHTGAVFTDHTVKAQFLTMTTLDKILVPEYYDQLTRSIMWDLGFQSKVIFGDSLSQGRAGGSDIDIQIQLAISRWKWHRAQFLNWCKYISEKYAAMQKSESLQKSLDTLAFLHGAISIEQAEIIKAKIMPLFGAGALSVKTSLKDSGYNYDTELQNKKDEKADGDLFAVRNTFSQTVDSGDGKKQDTTSPMSKGRPPEGQNPKVAGSADAEDVTVSGKMSSVDSFKSEITRQFDEMSEEPDEPKVVAFIAWLYGQLRARMTAAYQDGYNNFGGYSDLNYELLETAPQGMDFQLERLNNYTTDLKARAGDPEKIAGARFRASQYAGAIHTAYTLGAQAAMQSHGATHWRRVLHPELSIAGPCPDCTADAGVLHDIKEPFFEFHPNGVCSAQSVMFGFGNGTQVETPIANWGIPTNAVIRRRTMG